MTRSSVNSFRHFSDEEIDRLTQEEFPILEWALLIKPWAPTLRPAHTEFLWRQLSKWGFLTSVTRDIAEANRSSVEAITPGFRVKLERPTWLRAMCEVALLAARFQEKREEMTRRKALEDSAHAN